MLLYPSLMAADPLTLAATITQLEPYCAGFHLDTMDGHLVPNIIGGPAWINAIAHYTQKSVWVHLMVTDPLSIIKKLALKPTSMIDFQVEAPVDHNQLLITIQKLGHKAGISIAPQTPLSHVEPLLKHCDYITIMGVNPGFAGQKYIPETTHRIEQLYAHKKEHNLNFFITCDGGITESLIPSLAEHGISHAAIGSALFNANDPVAWLTKNGAQY